MKTGRDEARCKICGGQIHRWHSTGPNGRWFHETISTDDKPFDPVEWLRYPKKRHIGEPV